MRYLAFLRGINVGGHHTVKMSVLKTTLESLGLTEVITVLNSGNVAFDATRTTPTRLTAKLESALKQSFGFGIPVVVRTSGEIETLIESAPFDGIVVTPDTRLYVTFLAAPKADVQNLANTYGVGAFRILRVSPTEIFSVLEVGDKKTVDLMAIIEKVYGKNVTTRNWNTVVKLARP